MRKLLYVLPMLVGLTAEAVNLEYKDGLRNAALGRQTAQSSIYYDPYGQGVPDNGNDGNTSGMWTERSVTHTLQERDPWWRVSLGADIPIHSVSVWSRTDCCLDRMSQVKLTVTNKAGHVVYETLLSDGQIAQTVQLPANVVGESVRLSRQGDGLILSLAEVAVWTPTGPHFVSGTTPEFGGTVGKQRYARCNSAVTRLNATSLNLIETVQLACSDGSGSKIIGSGKYAQAESNCRFDPSHPNAYAIGIYGRSGSGVDGLGLICAEPDSDQEFDAMPGPIQINMMGDHIELPPLGSGTGGTRFRHRCPAGTMLTGLNVKQTDYYPVETVQAECHAVPAGLRNGWTPINQLPPVRNIISGVSVNGVKQGLCRANIGNVVQVGRVPLTDIYLKDARCLVPGWATPLTNFEILLSKSESAQVQWSQDKVLIAMKYIAAGFDAGLGAAYHRGDAIEMGLVGTMIPENLGLCAMNNAPGRLVITTDSRYDGCFVETDGQVVRHKQGYKVLVRP